MALALLEAYKAEDVDACSAIAMTSMWFPADVRFNPVFFAAVMDRLEQVMYAQEEDPGVDLEEALRRAYLIE